MRSPALVTMVSALAMTVGLAAMAADPDRPDGPSMAQAQPTTPGTTATPAAPGTTATPATPAGPGMTAAAPAAPAAPAEFLPGNLLGDNVRNARGEVIGEIVGVRIAGDGKIGDLIVDLASGGRDVSIPMADMTITENGEKVVTTLSAEQLTALKAYEFTEPARRGRVFGAAGVIAGPPGGVWPGSMPPPAAAPTWAFRTFYNDTDEIATWVSTTCGTKDATGVRGFVVQKGWGQPYFANVWCRMDHAYTAWQAANGPLDANLAPAVTQGLWGGNLGVLGFISGPAGDIVVMLRRAN